MMRIEEMSVRFGMGHLGVSSRAAAQGGSREGWRDVWDWLSAKLLHGLTG
jgi:hypothetical protein